MKTHLRARFIRPGRVLLLAAILCFATPPVSAQSKRSGHSFCGTGKGLVERVREVHQKNLNRVGSQSSLAPPADRDIGEIAILVDDGTLFVGALTDTHAIIQRFYEAHPDYWDYVVFFNNAGAAAEFGFAFEHNIRGLVGGIGYEVFEDFAPTGGYASFNFNDLLEIDTYKLNSIVNMANLGAYEGPDGILFGGPTGLEILAHEISHQFAVNVEPDNAMVTDFLSGHWSFLFDVGASVLQGNSWLDNGDGSFTSLGGFHDIPELDEYLWGLRLADDVTYPSFVITNPDPPLSPILFPAPDVTVSGTRVDVTVQNFIDQNGPRVPDADDAQHHFKIAFALVVPQGSVPPPADLEEVNAFRSAIEGFFAEQTETAGSLDTALTTAEFEADVQAGVAPLTVQFTDLSYGDIVTRSWGFGDGEISLLENPSHTFEEPGLYTVSLAVASPSATRTTTRDAFIVVGGRAPLADDFEGPGGWTVGDPSDTATDGLWTRRDPFGTLDAESLFEPQPEDDHTPGTGIRAYVTGNSPQGFGPADAADVDGGVTSLMSPGFDLSMEADATLVFWIYGYNRNMEIDDTFAIDLSDDGGTTWARVQETAVLEPNWTRQVVSLTGILPFNSNMRLRFQAKDTLPENEVEVALDDVFVLSTAPSIPFDCDLSVTSTLVDYDPGTVGIQEGPGASGQAVSCQVSILNDGIYPITEATLTVTAAKDSIQEIRSVTVTDFDPNTPGDQELATDATAAVVVHFESGPLEQCGVYDLVVSSDGSQLECRDGAQIVVGDEDASDDQDLSPPKITLAMGALTLTIPLESRVIEDVENERITLTARLQGFGSGTSPVNARFTFDVVEGLNPDTVVFPNLRPVLLKTVATSLDRSATLSLRLSVTPSLPRGTALRLRVRMTDTATGSLCVEGISEPFQITG